MFSMLSYSHGFLQELIKLLATPALQIMLISLFHKKKKMTVSATNNKRGFYKNYRII